MICPKCGNELGEGNMYCEKCGEEIHIVPDFEPEIENSLSEVLTNIADDINPDSAGLEKKEDKKNKETNKSISDDVVVIPKKILIFAVMAIIVVFVICTMLFIVSIKKENSCEYQLAKGDEALKNQQYSAAIAYYEHAKKFSEGNLEPFFRIALCYSQMGNVDRTIDTYIDILNFDPNNRVALESLIQIYINDKNYEAVSRLIADCSDEEFQNKYIDYLVKAPRFSLEEGEFDEIKVLEIIPPTEGSVFYTLDGSMPNSNCALYTEPITLRNGKYIVNAIFVNEMGLASDVSSCTYVINSNVPLEPVVSLADGVYEVPQNVSVVVPAGTQVYYTTDGSEPCSTSAIYLHPIAIPMGESHYRFISINEEGIESLEVERHYTLNIECNISESQAIDIVANRQFELGRVINIEGNIEGGTGKYTYSYNAIRYVHNKTFHFISEYYQESNISMLTGNLFAVDVYDGSVYQAVEGANNTYSLISY